MKLILFESISVNGMMGRPDGRGDFFSDHCWHGFVREAQATGAMLWGRRTHERVRGWARGMEQLTGISRWVLTAQQGYDPGRGWRAVGTPEAAVDQFRKNQLSAALIVGGQTVNTAFLRARLLDEVIFFMEAVLIPRGMPVFQPLDVDCRLALLEVKRETDCVLRLHYQVLRN